MMGMIEFTNEFVIVDDRPVIPTGFGIMKKTGTDQAYPTPTIESPPMPFLTLEDPNAKIKGSRDALGILPIWIE